MLVLVATSRESTAARRSRGPFTLHDERASAPNTYTRPFRARGHVRSKGNTTISNIETISNDGKPHHHITLEHAPRARHTHPATSTDNDWYGDSARTSRGSVKTTSNVGTTSNCVSLNQQMGRPRMPRRHAASSSTSPRSRSTAQARPPPSTCPSHETRVAALEGNHQQRRAGPGRLYNLWPANPGRHGHPHHPRPWKGGDWGSLAWPWLARKPRGPLARR